MISDLEAVLNCNPAILWERPEAEAYKSYCRTGGYAWTDVPGQTIPDSNNESCFSIVGYCAKLPGKNGAREYSEVTRKVKRAVKKIISEGVSDEVKEALLESLTYVLPPGDETAMIKSLKGQAAKQKTARPSLESAVSSEAHCSEFPGSLSTL